MAKNSGKLAYGEPKGGVRKHSCTCCRGSEKNPQGPIDPGVCNLLPVLGAVARVAQALLECREWQKCLHEALRVLGESIAASRVYVFRNQSGPRGQLLTSQVQEWVAAGVSPQIANPDLQGLPLRQAGFARWIRILSSRCPVCGPVCTFPAAERAVLEPQSILSLLVVPIFTEGTWWGFIGFDECKARRVWSKGEIDALQAAANILGAAIARVHIEAALQDSREELQSLFESMHDFAFVLDANGCILRVNRAVIERLGYSREELLGRSVLKLHPEDRRAEAAATVAAMLRNQRQFCPVPLQARSGQLIPVETRVTRGQVLGQEVLFGISRDITERVRADAEIRQAHQKLMHTREEERERIARDIHDTVCQELVAASMVLSRAGKAPENSEVGQANILHEAAATCTRLVGTARRICYDLYPPALGPLGLVPIRFI